MANGERGCGGYATAEGRHGFRRVWANWELMLGSFSQACRLAMIGRNSNENRFINK